MIKYELTFEEHSYGFRPERNIHKAVTQALKNINDCPDSYLIHKNIRRRSLSGNVKT
jgi:retron-type reverse transcriptase